MSRCRVREFEGKVVNIDSGPIFFPSSKFGDSRIKGTWLTIIDVEERVEKYPGTEIEKGRSRITHRHVVEFPEDLTDKNLLGRRIKYSATRDSHWQYRIEVVDSPPETGSSKGTYFKEGPKRGEVFQKIIF